MEKEKNIDFSHLDDSGSPRMVDVGNKQETKRIAKAVCTIELPAEIMTQFKEGDIETKKGPVFQTAILAGIMGAKKKCCPHGTGRIY